MRVGYNYPTWHINGFLARLNDLKKNSLLHYWLNSLHYREVLHYWLILLHYREVYIIGSLLHYSSKIL